MHRVELKVFSSKEEFLKANWEFLMHRVELKDAESFILRMLKKG